MKGLVFDSSTLIVLTNSCNLWVLDTFKDKVEFLIPEWVWEETVGKALHIDRFRLEGIRLDNKIREGVIKVVKDEKARSIAERIMGLVNNTFSAHGRYLRIIHKGESEMIGLALARDIKHVAIDERTTRILIEKPELEKKVLESKLHTKIRVDYQNLRELKSLVGGLKVLRSVDILVYAFKKGLFKVDEKKKVDLLRGILWSAKQLGCAISPREIDQYLDTVKV